MSSSVLVVCSSNICRSPLALAALDRALTRHGFRAQVTLRSRGEDAEPGFPACEQAMRTASRHGLSTWLLEQHRSAPLDPRELAMTDLILTADRTVRASVVRLDPRVAGRTFTVREATLLARRLPVGAQRPRDLAGFAAALNDNRGLTELPTVERPWVLPWPRLQVHAHDVPDCHIDPRASHRVVYRTLVPAIDELVDHLTTYIAVRQV